MPDEFPLCCSQICSRPIILDLDLLFYSNHDCSKELNTSAEVRVYLLTFSFFFLEQTKTTELSQLWFCGTWCHRVSVVLGKGRETLLRCFDSDLLSHIPWPFGPDRPTVTAASGNDLRPVILLRYEMVIPVFFFMITPEL